LLKVFLVYEKNWLATLFFSKNGNFFRQKLAQIAENGHHNMDSRFRRFSRSGFRLQGCQMVFIQTKNPNLGKFWRVLQRKMLYFNAICSILRSFGIFFPVLVFCTKKNLATLLSKRESDNGARQRRD
jgi:hypothetical protein